MMHNSIFVICSYEKYLVFINIWIYFRVVCRDCVALDQNLALLPTKAISLNCREVTWINQIHTLLHVRYI